MKKVLFSLSMFAVLVFVGQSCKKASADSDILAAQATSQNYDAVDNASEDFEAPDIDELTDPIGYEPDALTVTVGTLTRATATEDQAANCDAFKYAPVGKDASVKVGYGGNAIDVAITLAGLPIGSSDIDSIVNTNSSTGKYAEDAKVAKVGGRLVISNVTKGVDSLHYTFKLAASVDTFRAGSCAAKIYYRVTKAGVTTAKYKTVTIKCVGVNGNVNTFGTQKWGYELWGGNASKYTAEGTAFPTFVAPDTVRYVPAVGDVLRFGSDKRALVTAIISTTAPVTAAQILKGTKYVLQYKIMDPTCKSTTKVAKLTYYDHLPATQTLTIASGTATLTKFVH